MVHVCYITHIDQFQHENITVDKVTDKQNLRQVVGMTINLLDALPVANLLNNTCPGIMFVASKFGNQYLNRFVGINTTAADHNEALLKHVGRTDAVSVTDNNLVSFLSAVFLNQQFACSFAWNL